MSSSTTNPRDMPCPDPSAHEHSKPSTSSAASKAALLVTRAQREATSASRDSMDSNDGRLASNSASHNLKYAKAQDLPSFPSRGSTSGAAFAAAVLAKDYTMKELWQHETSAAGSKAAMLAHRDGGNVDLWQPSASAAGNSAANIAMRNKGLSPEIDRGYTDVGRNNSSLAAAMSVRRGRQRAGSTPAAPVADYPDAHNSTKNALNAATVSHRTSVRVGPSSDGWDSEAMQAARIKNSRMSRDMFGEHPPVEPEVEEQNHQAALRASAVSMAKSMYDYQNRAATPTDTSSVVGTAGRGAEAAHRRNQSSTSQSDLKDEALRYIHLQEAAQRIAHERLAKMDQGLDAGRYKEYYGYGNTKTSPKKSRLSVRRRPRAASEGQRYDDDSSDEERARRIRGQMSQLSTAQNTVSDKQRQEDRARLLAAAEKRVQARMHDMDQKVFLETGKVSQAMMDEWEAKARDKAQQNKVERDREAPAGKTHIGGGRYMGTAEIEAIAAARLKGTLDEITQNAERMRARDEELARQKDAEHTARMEEKMKDNEQKAEFKRLREQDKANARKEKADREALLLKEKQERKAAADKEKADREAAARKEKEDRRKAKEAAKARNEEEKRKQKEALYTLAGGATIGTVANKVKEDKEREERRDEESQAAGADTLQQIATRVKEDKKTEERRETEATVAGGVALSEVATRVKEDKEREERRDQESQAASADALSKVATRVKEDKEKEDQRKSREAAAGGATLAEVADRVRRDREAEQRQSVESPTSFASNRDTELAGAGAVVAGASGVAGYEAIQHDRSDTGPAPNTIGPHQTDVANILDPSVEQDSDKQKEAEPLTFGPHRSDITNIVDPRVDSQARPVDADEEKEPAGDEGFAALGGGMLGTGAVAGEAEVEPKPQKLVASPAKEQSSEKRGMFSRIGRRLKSKPEPQRPGDDPSTEAADGAGAAGIPVLGTALAAAGGTDEQRGETESTAEKTSVRVAESKDDMDDVDRTRAAEAMAGVGGVGVAAAIAAGGSGEVEQHEQRDEVSSLDSTDNEREDHDLHDPVEHDRPNLERHISTIHSSSESDWDGEPEREREHYDFEDGVGFSRVTADSPDVEEQRGRTLEPAHAPVAVAAVPARSPVSPLTPDRELAPPTVAAAAPAPTTPARPSEEGKAASQPEKERKGIRGIFRKLKGKPENKLTKKDARSVGSAPSVHSATDEEPVAVAAATTTAHDDGTVHPVTTTSFGEAEHRGLTDGTVAGTQRLGSGGDVDDPPESPSSFRRGDTQPHRDVDDVSSSGAEEEDVKVGRGGRLARKLGLAKDQGNAREPGRFGAAAAGPVPVVSGSEYGSGDGDDDQFEEAQDHFDENAAPPPAFAGQARHSGEAHARETKFQEEFGR